MHLLTVTLLIMQQVMQLAIPQKLRLTQLLTIIHTTELLEIRVTKRKRMIKRSLMNHGQPSIRITTRIQASKYSSLKVLSLLLALLRRSTSQWPTIPRKLPRNRLQSLRLRNCSNQVVQPPMPRILLHLPM